jgi:hypothetical protein
VLATQGTTHNQRIKKAVASRSRHLISALLQHTENPFLNWLRIPANEQDEKIRQIVNIPTLSGLFQNTATPRQNTLLTMIYSWMVVNSPEKGERLQRLIKSKNKIVLTSLNEKTPIMRQIKALPPEEKDRLITALVKNKQALNGFYNLLKSNAQNDLKATINTWVASADGQKKNARELAVSKLAVLRRKRKVAEETTAAKDNPLRGAQNRHPKKTGIIFSCV